VVAIAATPFQLWRAFQAVEADKVNAPLRLAMTIKREGWRINGAEERRGAEHAAKRR
jgi:hypothetical protein